MATPIGPNSPTYVTGTETRPVTAQNTTADTTVQAADAVPQTDSTADVSSVHAPGSANFSPDGGVSFNAQGSAVASQPIPSYPESIPEATKVNYSDFSRALNNNPRVSYIELDRQDTNKGLAEFLSHYGAVLDANPNLRDKLAQSEAGQLLLQALDSAKDGRMGTDDIIKLQTFIVASGAGHLLQHANSETGIDGDYGPKTHEALQQVFGNLLEQPNDVIGRFDQPVSQGLPETEELQFDPPLITQDDYYRDAVEGETLTQFALRQAENQRTDRHDMGNMITRDSALSENYEMPTGLPSSTSTGDQIVAAARRSQPRMAQILADLQRQSGRRHYRCYQGVKQVLNDLQPPISLSGGSAYQAAAQLRNNYADRFQSIQTLDPNSAQTKAYLRSLPAGAIVVWDRNESASLRRQNPHNGYSHGHISVALGGGQEYSDRYRNQITNNDGRYGSVTVFIPN